MKNNISKSKGISLIALIITIIVLVILTGTVIIVFNQANTAEKAEEAVFKNDMVQFRDQLRDSILIGQSKNEINTKSEVNVLVTDVNYETNIKKYIPNVTDKYVDGTNNVKEIEIQEGELKYIGINVNKVEWATELGIVTSASETPSASASETPSASASETPSASENPESLDLGDMFDF